MMPAPSAICYLPCRMVEGVAKAHVLEITHGVVTRVVRGMVFSWLRGRHFQSQEANTYLPMYFLTVR